MTDREAKLELLDFLLEEHEEEELGYDAYVEGFVMGLGFDAESDSGPDSRDEMMDWLAEQYVDYRTGRGDYRIKWYEVYESEGGV